MKLNRIIKKSRHYSHGWWWPWRQRIVIGASFIRIKFVVTEAMMAAHAVAPSCDDDWGKLTGLTSLFIHWKSARFGFRKNFKTGKFEVCEYRYRRGKRDHRNILGAFEVGDLVELTIWNPDIWFAFVNQPYYGGDCPAQVDIEFPLEVSFR